MCKDASVFGIYSYYCGNFGPFTKWHLGTSKSKCGSLHLQSPNKIKINLNSILCRTEEKIFPKLHEYVCKIAAHIKFNSMEKLSNEITAKICRKDKMPRAFVAADSADSFRF